MSKRVSRKHSKRLRHLNNFRRKLKHEEFFYETIYYWRTSRHKGFTRWGKSNILRGKFKPTRKKK